jgi:hypothetical protein
MGEVLRAGRADGLAACSIVDFVQAPASGALAQLEWQPCTALLGLLVLHFALHSDPVCIAYALRFVLAAAEGGFGRHPDPRHGHASPRSCCGRLVQAVRGRFRLVGSSGVLIVFDARDERTRRRVAPGQDRRLAGQAQRAGSEARPLKIRASSAYFE